MSFDAPHFTNEAKVREHLEAFRWPTGPVCPHCGSMYGAFRLEGAAHRPGLLKCKDCREQFSVTVGKPVFERSKITLTKLKRIGGKRPPYRQSGI